MGSSVSSFSSPLLTTNRKIHHGIAIRQDSQPYNEPTMFHQADAKSSILGNTLVQRSGSRTKQIPLSNVHKTSSFSEYLQKRVIPEKEQQFNHDIHSPVVDSDSDSEPINHSPPSPNTSNHLKYMTQRKSSPSTFSWSPESSNGFDWNTHSPQRQRSFPFLQQPFTIKTKKNTSSLVHTQSSKYDIQQRGPNNNNERKFLSQTKRSVPNQKSHQEEDDENDQLISQFIDSFRLRKAKNITPKTNDLSPHPLHKRLSFKYLLQNSSSDRREEFFIVVTPPLFP
ncbi:hypothetical protein FDP41_003630 [Naegleria fowleri]|uniref:Uncharacterized protein n=1 Tax=Naegleria fowleri TaxID=5763 RepID=A0A6A5BUM5_NAEFO|nr:uncharacterized protein FDP41_003630 [Naegleria fowleri]KAF0977638.1 hypothetical protein FDP41_003630 [Naegleria fowleri]